MWTANKRVATIGGANAHSRRDRLSFVTSFTLSNDTHRFWTRSYASRPGTWHRDSRLYYFLFFPRSSSSACPCLHRANLYTRSSLSLFLPASFRRYHRVSRFFFHGARAFETVEFDLLGLTRDPSSPETIRVAWDKGKSFCGVHSRFGF